MVRFCKSIVVILMLVFPVCAQVSDGGFSVIPYGQREVLQKWLGSNSFYRLAVESDCTNKEGLKATRAHWGSLYHPYYKTGEFNNDGNDDFAVVLVDKRKRKDNFDVAIFHGTAKGAYSARPVHLSKGFDFSSGGLFYNGYGKGGRLFAGPFESDDITTFTFVRNRYLDKVLEMP